MEYVPLNEVNDTHPADAKIEHQLFPIGVGPLVYGLIEAQPSGGYHYLAAKELDQKKRMQTYHVAFLCAEGTFAALLVNTPATGELWQFERLGTEWRLNEARRLWVADLIVVPR